MVYYIGPKLPYETPHLRVSTILEVAKWILNREIVCVDVETRPKDQWRDWRLAGLDPHTSDIVMLQIGDENDQYVIDTRTYADEKLVPVLRALATPNLQVVGHNITFDWKMLLSNFGLRLSNLIDTLVQEKVLTCGDQRRGFSLEALTTKYIGKHYKQTNQLDLFNNANGKGVNELFLSKSTREHFRYITDRVFSFEEIFYGAKDIEHTFKIYKRQTSLLIKNALWRTAILENHFAIVVAQMEYTGIKIDKEAWVQHALESESKLAVLKNEVLELIQKEDTDAMEKFRVSITRQTLFNQDILDINIASSQQMVALCQALGIDTKIANKNKKKLLTKLSAERDSVEKKYLKRYKNKFPIIGKYLAYQEMAKQVSTYGLPFLKHVNPVTGNIHSSFDQILATGRISSRTPNVQNIPRTKEYRKLFVPQKGWNLIIADYASQEVRCLADISGEETMIENLKSRNADPHSLTASNIFGVHVTNDEANPYYGYRHLGKIVNFLIPYGGGAHNLCEVANIELDKAKEIIEGYYKAYPRLLSFFETKWQRALLDGYLTIDPFTMRKSYNEETFKFIREVDNVIRKFGKEAIEQEEFYFYRKAKSKLKRDNQNYGIQGIAATMTKIALILLYNKILAHDLFAEVEIVIPVHDEILLHASDDKSNLAKEWLEWAMVSAGEKVMNKLTMFADVKIGKSWADKK